MAESVAAVIMVADRHTVCRVGSGIRLRTRTRSRLRAHKAGRRARRCHASPLSSASSSSSCRSISHLVGTSRRSTPPCMLLSEYG